jgi:chorismate mutase / prephenate dehydratase
MENQQNKTSEPALLALRQEIDTIDNQIIDLLGKRMQVINRVGELKKSNNEKFFIRSNREADMIKDLIKKSHSDFPKSAIVSIWRKIIASANMHEQSLNIALHNPKNVSDYSYLLREYYYDAVPINSHDSTSNVVAELEKGSAQIGVFELPRAHEDQEKGDMSDNWWIGLANNRSGIKIFAKIPFIESGDHNQINLVALAIKESEKSQEDNSLIYVEAKKEVSRSQILAAFIEQDLKAKILKSVKLPQVDDVIFYLIELEGFYSEEDVAIKNLTKSKHRPYVKVLGTYARPIQI